MDRRTFNKLAGIGALGALSPRVERGAPQGPPTGGVVKIPLRKVDWPSTTYRRFLIDTHVPDWDSLLENFNAADYVSTIAGAGFQSCMQYANSHVGLCLWRTKLGQMHRGMHGRDYFGEVMEECRRHGLHRVAYFSLIFDDWAYQNYPNWRILPEDGYDKILYSRLGTVCPNSPYRDHALACLRELVGNYDFEGIFLDMTFWPAVCYCPHCTERFWREHHNEPPRIVDWKDPLWRSFQKARERWMLEFAKTVTQTIKQTRPVSVYHQFGTAFAAWPAGVSLEQNDASDWCLGDFYGGAAQFSLVCKSYWGMTRTRPFEFATSRTLDLHDFETTKPLESMLLESLVPTIHSSACLLIDAIKPDGSLNHRAYEYLSQVNAQHDPYEPFLGGELLADVAIYFDKGSMYDPEESGKPVSEVAIPHTFGGPKSPSLKGETTFVRRQPPHLDAVVGSARILREAHIPFGVVTNTTLDQLGRFRGVILPGVLEMTTEQADRFRKFVQEGGVLYASGPSSLSVPGEGEPRFLLEDVLGVRYLGGLGSTATYLTPADPEVYELIWPQENVTYPGPMVQGKEQAGAQVLATVTLPIVDPKVGYAIGTHFAQIWSNPPATPPGRNPGIVVNSYGKGKAIWVAAPIESRVESLYVNLVTYLLQRALSKPYHFEVEANRAVEMTLFDQADKHRLLVGLLNMQTDVPTISVGGTVRVQVPAGRTAKRVLSLPEQKEIPFHEAGSYIQFKIAPFKILKMALVEYA
jgi:hypothetical protein